MLSMEGIWDLNGRHMGPQWKAYGTSVLSMEGIWDLGGILLGAAPQSTNREQDHKFDVQALAQQLKQLGVYLGA